ncbi:hypothetical protein S40288_00662 [Stachybotrys chartarum IBT 40288]|nr:hypothetical protein S40288_00662 [Stachybotrys chartarum IBT 40288]
MGIKGYIQPPPIITDVNGSADTDTLRIYRELGPGKRVALSKLAADCLATSNRPFRIAIDIAIWQFQTQAARGGTNPAIRTLFYRLTRLLGTPVHPIFVFDGPYKPIFKRNKRSGRGDGIANAQAKRLIRLFGFPIHDAPGEAEAECALLQKNGVVDAVLSEDVDTIMFGCTKTLRNWSAEGKSNTPTHVSVYDVHDASMANLGLDREGMVLVALMSGGDYLPEGIPGCGIKVACEAAKAGFGRICRLKASDTEGIRAWRESLVHELRTNEKGFFRTKHKALVIPDAFPNIDVLRYYTHPAVSPNLDSIRMDECGRSLDFEALREFARETFGWDYRGGAIKFIRVLAQATLVQNLQSQRSATHVQRISGRRMHFSTDAVPELRLTYVPQDLVPIDLSREREEDIPVARDGLALNSDDEFNNTEESKAKLFDVTKPELAWVLEEVVTKAAPDLLHAWQEEQRTKAISSKTKPKTKSSGRSKKSGMPHGSLDKFVQIRKESVAAEVQCEAQVGRKHLASTLALPPLRKAFRRPSSLSPLPKEPSKQHASTITISQLGAAETPMDSRMIPPRTPTKTPGPEAIIISSSPPVPAAPSPTTLQRPTNLIPPSTESSQAHVTQGARAPSQRARKPLQRSESSTSGLKQTSLDVFLKTSKSSNVKKENGSGSRTWKRSQSDQTPASHPSSMFADFDSDGFDEFDISPAPATKKLLIPRVSNVGYFKEVEVRPEDVQYVIARETRILQSKGIRDGVTRWSDVSIIDLTADDA